MSNKEMKRYRRTVNRFFVEYVQQLDRLPFKERFKIGIRIIVGGRVKFWKRGSRKNLLTSPTM